MAVLNVATLTTERLKLEPLSMAHSRPMYDLWAEPAVCRYAGVVKDYDGNKIDTPVADRTQSDLIIDFWQRAAADGWGFRWAILLRDSEHAFTGTIGFNSLRTCSEIAYHLLPKYWRQGIITEAAEAAIELRKMDGATEIEAFTEPENTPAVTLAHRLGMTATDTVSEGARRYLMSI